MCVQRGYSRALPDASVTGRENTDHCWKSQYVMSPIIFTINPDCSPAPLKIVQELLSFHNLAWEDLTFCLLYVAALSRREKRATPE